LPLLVPVPLLRGLLKGAPLGVSAFNAGYRFTATKARDYASDLKKNHKHTAARRWRAARREGITCDGQPSKLGNASKQKCSFQER
jgi:hypothetical protein